MRMQPPVTNSSLNIIIMLYIEPSKHSLINAARALSLAEKPLSSSNYSKTIPAPTNIAVVTYAASLRIPKSKAGTVTIPAAPLEVDELPEPELPLPEPERPVAAGALVIAPVPAEPAWLVIALQLEAGLALTF